MVILLVTCLSAILFDFIDSLCVLSQSQFLMHFSCLLPSIACFIINLLCCTVANAFLKSSGFICTGFLLVLQFSHVAQGQKYTDCPLLNYTSVNLQGPCPVRGLRAHRIGNGIQSLPPSGHWFESSCLTVQWHM